MAEISTIARPYAEAAFRVASDVNGGADMNAWSQALAELAAIAANADMQTLISDPRSTASQIEGVFTGVVGKPLTPLALNFLRELIGHGRLLALPEIAQQFHALKNAREGQADAEITSAFALSDAQVADLVAALESKFGVRLKANVTVDESLIGGVRVVVGDQVLDTSVRTRLEQMRASLTA